MMAAIAMIDAARVVDIARGGDGGYSALSGYRVDWPLLTMMSAAHVDWLATRDDGLRYRVD
jgi:hypothetical protein